jgi:hypothetical protein
VAEDNYICTIRKKEKFKRQTLEKRQRKDKDGRNVDLIIGKLKSNNATVVQGIEYPQSDWSYYDAILQCQLQGGTLEKIEIPQPKKIIINRLKKQKVFLKKQVKSKPVDHGGNKTPSPLIDHDRTKNYVANEHIDWTNTTESLVTTGDVTCDILNYTTLNPAVTSLTVAYGELYLHDTVVNIGIAAADTYYQITGWSSGNVNDITVESDSLKIATAGMYIVNWSVSASTSSYNQTYQFQVYKEGAASSKGSARTNYEIAGAGYWPDGFWHGTGINGYWIIEYWHGFDTSARVLAAAGTAIINCAVNDNLALYVENIGNSANLDIYNACFTAHRIGASP